MTNQLRSTFYLLSRDAYLKGAVVVPVLVLALCFGIQVLVGAQTEAGVATVAWGSLVRGLLSVGVVFGAAFAMTGLVAHDAENRGLRLSCLAERGRARYVAARLVAAAAVAVALAAWTSLLALAARLLPGVSDYSPLMVTSSSDGPATLAELVPWALVAALVGWAYATVGMLLVWVRGDGLGFFGVCLLSFLLASGVAESLLTSIVVFASVLVSGDPGASVGAFVRCLPSSAWALGAVPLVSGEAASAARVLLVPLCWAALSWLASWLRLARRNL